MEESLYDGFYAVVTNLEAKAHEIAQIKQKQMANRRMFQNNEE